MVLEFTGALLYSKYLSFLHYAFHSIMVLEFTGAPSVQ